MHFRARYSFFHTKKALSGGRPFFLPQTKILIVAANERASAGSVGRSVSGRPSNEGAVFAVGYSFSPPDNVGTSRRKQATLCLTYARARCFPRFNFLTRTKYELSSRRDFDGMFVLQTYVM